jgi:hypothetical protein
VADKTGKAKLKKDAAKEKSKALAAKEQYSKEFKKRKSQIEQYLYEVEKCVKAGGKSMECKIQVRDVMDKKDREET